jgi:hypothetical protein
VSRLTASQLARVLRCPGSATLPHEDTSSEAAARGTAVHEFLELVPVLGRDESLALVAEEFRPVCEALDLRGLPIGLAAEVTLAFDVSTGQARELGRGLRRDYSGASSTEIVGTADVLGVGPDAVFVADWKTGWDVEAPATNPQVRFLAMAAARAYGRTRAVAEIIRLREAGPPWRERAELDVFDLDEVAVQMRALAARVEADEVAFNQGPWCKRCPSFAHCPAKIALLRRLADGTETHEMELMLPLTAEMASVAYRRWKLAKELLRRVEAALHEFASHQPIAIGEGRWFGELLTEGTEQLDGDVVWEVLRRRFDRDVADQAVTRTATKARLREVLRARQSKPRSLAKTERAVLAEIRNRGGAIRPVRRVITEYAELPAGKEQAS